MYRPLNSYPSDDHGTVCRSEPRTSCVILASTERQQLSATVHLYYHSTRRETKYAGTVQIGFFRGSAAGHDLKPSFTVKANSLPISQAVSDIVTTIPGHYPVRISVVATVGSGRTQTIEDDIQVEVRSNGRARTDHRREGT